MILDSLNNSSIILVSDMLDVDKSPIIITIKVDGKGMFNNVEVNSNFVTSYYGKDGFSSYIKNSIHRDAFLYINKEKAIDLSAESSTQWLEQLKDYDFNTIIRKTNANVNKNKKISMRNSAYLEAVENNDLETAQRLVEEVAKESGYTINSADSVTYDDNGNVIPLSERFNEAKSDIRYQSRSSNSDYDFSKELTKTDYSDLTTLDDRERTVYNKRGWTCRLFSKEDRILLGEKFNELDNKITRKTDNVLEDCSKIVEVNNKIVLIRGTFSEPEINCVLAINAANETEALGIKEAIFYEYPNYRKNKETLGDFLQYVQTYEEFVRTYRAEDFSYYKGQVDTGERATLPDNFKNYGYTKQFQDRTGSNSNAGQGVSDRRVNDNVDTSAAVLNYVSDKHMDLTVQTMYSGKEKAYPL